MRLIPTVLLMSVCCVAGAQAPTVSKDCKGLSGQARTECLKVAKQMEREAANPSDPATATPENNGPGTEPIHHSSPIMQTPEEKKAAAQRAKPPKDRPADPPAPK